MWCSAEIVLPEAAGVAAAADLVAGVAFAFVVLDLAAPDLLVRGFFDTAMVASFNVRFWLPCYTTA